MRLLIGFGKLSLLFSLFIIFTSCTTTDTALVSSTTPEESLQVFDFRNVLWGMSVDEVKQSEESLPVEYTISMGGASFLDYIIYVDGKSLVIRYRFDSDGLYGVFFDSNRLNLAENINSVYEYYLTLINKFNDHFGSSTNIEDNSSEVHLLGRKVAITNRRTFWLTENNDAQLWMLEVNFPPASRYFGFIAPVNSAFSNEMTERLEQLRDGFVGLADASQETEECDE